MSGFDHIVHIRDTKTGRVVQSCPYRLVITKDGATYERDGKKYDAQGNEIVENRNTSNKAGER